MHTIYVFENRMDGRVYIGQSVQPRVRKHQHVYALRAGKHHCIFFQRAWAKYGENAFSHFVLLACGTKEEADSAEVALIAWYRSLDLCYNCGEGGGGLSNPDEETRQKMRDARVGWKPTPEHMAKVQAGLKAKGRTEEHRRKVGEAKKGNTDWLGRHHTEESKQKNAEAHKGEKNGMFGKSASDKQKASASATWKGVKRGPMSEETKQKIREVRAKQVMQPRKPK